MCFAVEQENARLVLSLFIHEILSTRLTLLGFHLSIHGPPIYVPYIAFLVDDYYYYSLARHIYIHIYGSSAFGFGIERIL